MRRRSKLSPSILAVAVCLVMSLAMLRQGVIAQSRESPRRDEPGHYRIAGTVVSKTDGHPLDRARILLRDSKARNQPLATVTSPEGKFSFENVGAGKYSLEGLKPGFITAAYDQHDQYSTAIVTGAGLGTENLILRLSPAAMISGRVLDEAGETVRHAMVTLYRSNHFQGVEQIQMVRGVPTDDLGAYEMASLNPGTYFLAVRAQPWYGVHPPATADHEDSGGNARPTTNVDRSLDVAYPMTYYQNATEPDGATPILIRGGERMQIDMSLSPVPSLRLLFHLPAGQKGQFIVPQLEQSAFDGSAPLEATPRQVSPGVMELTGVPAGRYNVRTFGDGTFTQLNGVDFNKDGDEVDLSAAEPLGTVKFSATVQGEAVIPPGLAVGLTHERAALRSINRFSPKGESEIARVSQGTYEVLVLGAGRQYVIVGISADGAQVRGHTITVPAAASATVALTLAPGVEVRGVVKKAGKPFAEAMVVLVPKDAEGNRDLFRRDQSDLDGTFSLRGVVPGSYTLVAIEDGWDLDWSRPEIIAPYRKRGQPVEISSKASAPVEGKEAIEVQPK